MSALEAFARLVGIRREQAEEVLHSEASARAQLSRRGFFVGVGAVAAGSCFSFLEANPLKKRTVWVKLMSVSGYAAFYTVGEAVLGDLVSFESDSSVIPGTHKALPILGRVVGFADE